MSSSLNSSMPSTSENRVEMFFSSWISELLSNILDIKPLDFLGGEGFLSYCGGFNPGGVYWDDPSLLVYYPSKGVLDSKGRKK